MFQRMTTATRTLWTSPVTTTKSSYLTAQRTDAWAASHDASRRQTVSAVRRTWRHTFVGSVLAGETVLSTCLIWYMSVNHVRRITRHIWHYVTTVSQVRDTRTIQFLVWVTVGIRHCLLGFVFGRYRRPTASKILYFSFLSSLGWRRSVQQTPQTNDT